MIDFYVLNAALTFLYDKLTCVPHGIALIANIIFPAYPQSTSIYLISIRTGSCQAPERTQTQQTFIYIQGKLL